MKAKLAGGTEKQSAIYLDHTLFFVIVKKLIILFYLILMQT